MAPRPYRPARITVFRTPVIRTILRWIAALWLWAFRWKTVLVLPDDPKAVAVIAPHTSYWDFPVLVAAGLKHGVDVHWLGTHRLFRGPGRPLFRWLGGIPVDRSRSNGLVAAAIDAMRADEHGMLTVAPEGTRYRRDAWKTGFHRIAVGAGVPLFLVGLDYGTKTVRADVTFMPGDDVKADLVRIGEFYAPMQGKHPELFTPPAHPGA